MECFEQAALHPLVFITQSRHNRLMAVAVGVAVDYYYSSAVGYSR
jgi:hypothetical protein